MPIAADILARPLCGVRERISQAIDRVTANAAGTIGGRPMRGVWRRESAPTALDWGHQVAGSRITLSVDEALIPAAFSGQPLPDAADRWSAGSSPTYLTDSAGAWLTDPIGGQRVEPTPAEPRQTGMSVEITAGVGIGRYTVAGLEPHDGGRVLLVLSPVAEDGAA